MGSQKRDSAQRSPAVPPQLQRPTGVRRPARRENPSHCSVQRCAARPKEDAATRERTTRLNYNAVPRLHRTLSVASIVAESPTSSKSSNNRACGQRIRLGLFYLAVPPHFKPPCGTFCRHAPPLPRGAVPATRSNGWCGTPGDFASELLHQAIREAVSEGPRTAGLAFHRT